MTSVPKQFPSAESEFYLPGPAGRLQVKTTWPAAGKLRGVALICHPHPLYQGTMNNKVVTILARSFDKLGLATLRFNYRGVGNSEGKYGEMIGEIEDLLSIYQWVQKVLPKLPVWLVGFSFGGFITASVANQQTVAQLITVAPAVTHADFNELTNIHCPWLIIQGEADEVVESQAVKDFAAKPPVPVVLKRMPDTSHFFHGKLLELRDLIVEYF